MNYNQYCNLMWQLVDLIIDTAEYQVCLKLSPGDRRYVKQVVVWKLVEVTRLPIDLASHPALPLDFAIAPLPNEKEIQKAIARLMRRFPNYKILILQKLAL
jgi:hypothetical protein